MTPNQTENEIIKLKDLQAKANEIDSLVEESILSDKSDTWVITDGIVDIEKYFNAKYKIMWILKEPYCEGDGTGGGWDLKEVVRSKQTIYEFKSSRNTFKPMIYVSWGILNSFCLYDDMPDVEDDSSLLEALKSIAYINVKKIPGFTSSRHTIIKAAYREHKEILHKQIEDYNPDIIIAGSTLYNFFPYFNIKREELIRNKSINYIVKK